MQYKIKILRFDIFYTGVKLLMLSLVATQEERGQFGKKINICYFRFLLLSEANIYAGDKCFISLVDLLIAILIGAGAQRNIKISNC